MEERESTHTIFREGKRGKRERAHTQYLERGREAREREDTHTHNI
jgi:hypothetical protein